MLEVQLSELQEQQESLAREHWAATSYITTEEQEQEYLKDNPYVGAFVLNGELGEVQYIGKIGRDIQLKVTSPWSFIARLEPQEDSLRLFYRHGNQFIFSGYVKISEIEESFIILGREKDFSWE